MTTESMITLSAALAHAAKLGASSYYTPFKAAVFNDKVVKKALVAVPQGPHRTVYLMPRDIGMDFAARYAVHNPIKRQHPKAAEKAAGAPETDPRQLTIDFDHGAPVAPPEPVAGHAADELHLLRAEVTGLNQRLTAMESKIDRLVALWEGDGK